MKLICAIIHYRVIELTEKHFKNLDEQIEIMKFKGLVIEDEDYAKEILLRENYFFINGYRYPFFQSAHEKKFITGTRFEELYSLFLFDRSIRNVIFKNLLVVENNIKSILSYQLSKKYGYREKDYLKAKNFSSDKQKQRQIADLIHKMKRQIRINGAQHSATKHYITNYGYIPLWILVKVLSFGIIGELFSILKRDDQQSICDIYHTDIETMSTYLPILSNYRNLCAHEDILYDNRTQKIIPDTIYHQLLGIEQEDGEYISGKNDLFALFLMLKQMLSKEEFQNMTIEIENYLNNLEYNLKTIPIDKILKRMGFPLNWRSLDNMERSHSNDK